MHTGFNWPRPSTSGTSFRMNNLLSEKLGTWPAEQLSVLHSFITYYETPTFTAVFISARTQAIITKLSGRTRWYWFLLEFVPLPHFHSSKTHTQSEKRLSQGRDRQLSSTVFVLTLKLQWQSSLCELVFWNTWNLIHFSGRAVKGQFCG